MSKRVLITGAKGFIGGALWRYLEENLKYDIFGIDLKRYPVSKRVYPIDILEQEKIRKILSDLRPQLIFHLTGGRLPDREELFKSNFLATKILLDTIRTINHYNPRIIIPGTAAEYGKAGSGIKRVEEDYAAKPMTWYGFVKNMQVNVSLLYARQGMDIVVGRMFNISGQGIPTSLAIGYFSKEIARKERRNNPGVMMTKNLDSRRDYLDVFDVSSALAAIARYGKRGEIYNICSGKSYAMRELLWIMLSYAKVKDIIVKENKQDSAESFDVIGCNTKIKAETPWRPQISIRKSLLETLRYYRRQYSKGSSVIL